MYYLGGIAEKFCVLCRVCFGSLKIGILKMWIGCSCLRIMVELGVCGVGQFVVSGTKLIVNAKL